MLTLSIVWIVLNVNTRTKERESRIKKKDENNEPMMAWVSWGKHNAGERALIGLNVDTIKREMVYPGMHYTDRKEREIEKRVIQSIPLSSFIFHLA